MAEVGSAFVSLVPSAKGFGKATEKQVGGEMTSAGKGIGSKFGSAIKAGALLAVGGAFAAGKFLTGALDEAREAQVVGARTDNVIKKMGASAWTSSRGIAAFAGELSTKVGIDDEAIQSGENLLLTFGNVQDRFGKGNDIFRQTTSLMVDMSAAMGTDMKGSAIQLGKALNDPTKGVTALTRVGVAFTESQKAQIKKLQESGDLLGAQKIVLGEVKKEFSGAAKAMATPGQKAAVAWGNLKEQIGTGLLPVVDKLLGFVTSKLIPGVSAFVAQMQSGNGVGGQLVATLKGLGQAIQANVLPVIVSFGSFLTTSVLPALRQVIPFLVRWQNVLVPLVAGIVAIVVALKIWRAVTTAAIAVQATFNAVLAANPIGLVVLALIGLGAALVVAYKKSQTFRNVVDGAFSAVKDVVSSVGGAFKSVWEGVSTWLGKAMDFIRNMPGAIKAAFSGIWGGLAGGLKEAVNAVLHLPMTIPRIDTHIPGVGTVGGQTLIPALAKGGIVTSPTMALIGEAGTEVVTPLSKLSSMLSAARDSGAAARAGTSKTILRVGDREFVAYLEELAEGVLDGHSALAAEGARAHR